MNTDAGELDSSGFYSKSGEGQPGANGNYAAEKSSTLKTSAQRWQLHQPIEHAAATLMQRDSLLYRHSIFVLLQLGLFPRDCRQI